MIELSLLNWLFAFGATILSSSVIAALVSIKMTHQFQRKKIYREKLEECVYFNSLYNKIAVNHLLAYSGATSGHLTSADDFYSALSAQAQGDTPDAWPKLHASVRLHFKELHKVIDGYEQLQKDFACLELLIERYYTEEQKPSKEDHSRVLKASDKLTQLNDDFLRISQVVIKKYAP